LFRKYALANLRPVFAQPGWEPKSGEPPRVATLRADLIEVLGLFGDQEIVTGCQQRFRKFLANPKSLPPDLRSPVLHVVGQNANEEIWTKLHELGLRTTSIEEKQNYYEALAYATDPKLIDRTLEIALTEELPSSRALYLVQKVARNSDHPELAWDFAKAHMKELMAKADALEATRYPPSLFTFFSDPIRIGELQAYAKNNLVAGSATDKAVAQAVNEIGFRSEFKQRLIPQLTALAVKPIKPGKPSNPKRKR
jgi:aminopeptidase N